MVHPKQIDKNKYIYIEKERLYPCISSNIYSIYIYIALYVYAFISIDLIISSYIYIYRCLSLISFSIIVY